MRPNSQTTLCLSFAANPGNFGCRFHNFLFEKLGLNFIYLSRKIVAIDEGVSSLRSLEVRGCGVTMPFKDKVIRYLDELDPVAQRIGAVNTIVNDHGRL